MMILNPTTITNKKYSLWMIVVFYLLIVPYSMSYLDFGISVEISKYMYILVLVVQVVAFIKIKKPIISGMETIVGFVLLSILCTVFNGISDLTIYWSALRIVIAIYSIGYMYADNSYKFLHSSEIVLLTLFILNLIILILFPDGIYISTIQYNVWDSGHVSYWIFGDKNSATVYTFILLLISGLRASLAKNKVIDMKWCVCYGICLTTLIFQQCTTGIISLLSIIVCYSMLQRTKTSTPRIFWLVLIGIAVLQILMVSGLIQYFSGLVLGLTGKNITFTGRVTAWRNAFELIKEKPILGYGRISYTEQAKLLGNIYFNSTHNMILQLLLNGGCVWLVYFVFMINYIIQKNKKAGNAYRAYIYVIIIAVFVEGLAESLIHSIQIIVLLAIVLCAITNPQQRGKVKII